MVFIKAILERGGSFSRRGEAFVTAADAEIDSATCVSVAGGDFKDNPFSIVDCPTPEASLVALSP